jgi:Protein of unknown function (DUF3800)
MPNKFIFVDEAGCFTFNRQPNVSRFFVLCTVVMDDCQIASELLSLRRQLAWQDHKLGDYFHATEDRQNVRDAVFKTLLTHDFSIQATIMEKSKAQPHVRESKEQFYQYAYYFHFKHGVSRQLDANSEALVTTASLGNRKERAAFESAVASVMRQTNSAKAWKTDFMPCHADPCLQVADYCAWAIQRRWERNDSRSYNLISSRITYEYDLWHKGQQHYY